jgi:hypothetical protein
MHRFATSYGMSASCHSERSEEPSLNRVCLEERCQRLRYVRILLPLIMLSLSKHRDGGPASFDRLSVINVSFTCRWSAKLGRDNVPKAGAPGSRTATHFGKLSLQG